MGLISDASDARLDDWGYLVREQLFGWELALTWDTEARELVPILLDGHGRIQAYKA